HAGDERHRLLSELTNDAHPIELRHLPVEKGEIRLLLLDHRDRFLARCRFTDDGDVFKRPQKRDEERPRRPFVVGDHDTKPSAHTATRSGAISLEFDVTGRRTSTVVPRPGALSMESDAAAPDGPCKRRSTLR